MAATDHRTGGRHEAEASAIEHLWPHSNDLEWDEFTERGLRVFVSGKGSTLTDAVLPGREITLEIDAFCGKLIVIVPEGAHVIDEGGALFAKRAIYGRGDLADTDGPLIRIVGDARFAKVAVHRGRFDPTARWQHWVQQGAAAR